MSQPNQGSQLRDPGGLTEENQGHFPFGQVPEEDIEPHNGAPMGCEPQEEEEWENAS